MDIFITDASFDFGSKTSIIGIENIITGKEYQKVFNDAKNPFEAEKLGIREVILISIQEGLKNILIFCDNKGAVVHSKKDFFNDNELKNKFDFIQFVWVPREFTEIADTISKNVVDENIKNDIINSKAENLNIKKEKLSNSYLEEHVNNINPSSEISNNTLKKRISQFLFLKEGEFKSQLFNKIDILSVEDMNDLIFEEIELIEIDIENISDEILKIIAKSIIDLVIIS